MYFYFPSQDTWSYLPSDSSFGNCFYGHLCVQIPGEGHQSLRWLVDICLIVVRNNISASCLTQLKWSCFFFKLVQLSMCGAQKKENTYSSVVFTYADLFIFQKVLTDYNFLFSKWNYEFEIKFLFILLFSVDVFHIGTFCTFCGESCCWAVHTVAKLYSV